ncbi:hypothetical protein MBLNU230_g0545t1 [Neophaeotheca triangularis]
MPASTESLAELSRPEYWNERYNADNPDAEEYEWLRDFSAIKPFLLTHLPPATTNPEISIVHMGNGNSTLPLSLLQLGYKSQTALDFSPIVTTKMSQLHPSPHLTWLTADIRATNLPSGSVDIAVDKATLDAMLYGSLWDPLPEVRENVGRYVDEVARLLKPGGKWVYVTWRQPHFILPLVGREGVWKVQREVVDGGGGMFEYYGFVMTKF